MSRNKKMTMTLAIAAVLFVLALAAWWYLFFGTPNPPLPRTGVSIQSSTASTAGAASTTLMDGENPPLVEETLSVGSTTFDVEVASTAIEQSRGLSFRPSLAAENGMLFTFRFGGIQTFWMKDMNFPLDMIWISGNSVVGFAENAPAPAPGTAIWQLPVYSSPDKTDKVLEVVAGTVAKYNIKTGDTVTIGPAK